MQVCYISSVDYRIERDTMGEMKVPSEALYGAQTQRAVENFPISHLRFPRAFIRALGLIKAAAARANGSMGQLPADLAAAIEEAAEEVAAGKYDSQFVVDIFQTGSGTSTNMNANEDRSPGERTSQRPCEPRPIEQRRDPQRYSCLGCAPRPRRVAACNGWPRGIIAKEG